MAIDLFILALVLLFGLVGAFSGAAKQIANIVALIAGYACARPLGAALAPKLSSMLGGPAFLGVVAGIFLVFIAVVVVVRYVVTFVLQRIMAGRDREDRGLDRGVGFLLGALKVLAVAYVVLSALVFVEENVGRRLGLSPKGSYAFQVARRFNLFELTQFAPMKDFVRVAQVASDPDLSAKVREDPAFRALRRDPRFQRAVRDPQVQAALERGDARALLRNEDVLELIQDPTLAARIAAAANASRR